MTNQKMYNPLTKLVRRIKMYKIQYSTAFGATMITAGFAMIIASYAINGGDGTGFMRVLGLIVGLIGFIVFMKVYSWVIEEDKKTRDNMLDKKEVNQLESAIKELTKEIRNQRDSIKK